MISRPSFENFLELMDKNWPKEDWPLHAIFPRIRRSSEFLAANKSEIMGAYGLQGMDFEVLAALRLSGEPYQLIPTQLFDYLFVSSGGLTKVLYRLEGKGLVGRSTHPGDGRVKLIHLTPAGKELIEEADRQLNVRHNKILAYFSPEEVRQFDTLMEKFLGAMSELQEEEESPIKNR